MRREPHENVATVLVDPALLRDLELELMELDLWVWPVRTAPICVDGPRTAFQVRRRLLEAQRGAWDGAAGWIPVWISFGERWWSGADPLPWSAHRALWDVLDTHAEQVRFHRRLGGVRPLMAPVERHAG
ncbi:hypothetical protein ASE01_18695 [Nocardioides sp. Root190]|uniref:hypothetical protein n=1 Tax=Nocardioides sp. Root190 TaxID=1736488 RepID=UPI0006FAA863|nr:hypothetical protein [Nocardioides sp. Root190]KRB74025.1 hypothetical protein ASE01_18695 [Nocardioides sp. Root190]